MNSRRVHELMRQHFPPISAAEREWRYIAGSSAQSEALLQELLEMHIGEEEVLIEVHRKLGALLPAKEAAVFACSHIGEGQIQNRQPRVHFLCRRGAEWRGYRLARRHRREMKARS